MKCASCKYKRCYEGKDCTDIKEQVKMKYKGETFKIMKAAAKTEAESYMKKARLEELIYFAKDMGYKKLGLAFCIGLQREAEVINKILSKDFEVFSTCCKICGIDKSDFRLEKLQKEKKIDIACNPVGQAEIFNKNKTDLNIILGLCIGHDILFTEHSKAPVTTLAVKDRVLAHNPLGAIYARYYRKRFFMSEH